MVCLDLVGLLLLALSSPFISAFQVVRFNHRSISVRAGPKVPHGFVSQSHEECSRHRPLWQGYDEENDDTQEGTPSEANIAPADPLVKDTSRILRRASWVSWWCQIILTTISGVILLFARNVVGRHREAMLGGIPTFFLSAAGIVASGTSLAWTWGNGARLSRRLLRRATGRVRAAHLLRRAIRVGVSLNMVGLFVTLLAAEQIVGSLSIKVLTSRPFGPEGAAALVAGGGSTYLQPLDILIVQANTNTLLSHFCSLGSLLYLTDRVDKLDPPSTEEKQQRQ